MDPTQLLWTQLAAGLFTLLFAGTLFNLIRLRSRIGAAAAWPAVEGVIIASSVDAPAAHVSDDANDARPVVRYRYRIGSSELEGNKISVGGEPLTTRTLATWQAARYLVGAVVDVHVDPKDPANALLDPSESGSVTAQLVFALTFGVIAAVLIAHVIAGHVLYTSKGVPLFAFLLPALAFVAVIAALMSFVRMRGLSSASLGWPTANGRITSSSVIEEWIEEKRSDNDSDNSNVNRKKIPRYQVDLRYAFRAGKRDFVGVIPNWGWTGVYGRRDGGDAVVLCCCRILVTAAASQLFSLPPRGGSGWGSPRRSVSREDPTRLLRSRPPPCRGGDKSLTPPWRGPPSAACGCRRARAAWSSASCRWRRAAARRRR